MKQVGKLRGGESFSDLKETLAQGSLVKNSPILVKEKQERAINLQSKEDIEGKERTGIST